MMNSLDYQNTRFARQQGESWVRPDYANWIEHHKPEGSSIMRWYPAVVAIVLVLSAVAGVYGAFSA